MGKRLGSSPSRGGEKSGSPVKVARRHGAFEDEPLSRPTRLSPPIDTINSDFQTGQLKDLGYGTNLPPLAHQSEPSAFSELNQTDDPFYGAEPKYCFDPSCQRFEETPSSATGSLPQPPWGRPQGSSSKLPLSWNDGALKYSHLEDAVREGGTGLSVHCERVISELERLLPQYTPKDTLPKGLYENNLEKGKVTAAAYYALEFCLRAMSIASDYGKNCFAFYLTKKVPAAANPAAMEETEKDSFEGDLVGIQECRRFVTRIRDLLKRSVQDRFVAGCAASDRGKLATYYDLSSFLTGAAKSAPRPALVDEAIEGSVTTSTHSPTPMEGLYMYRLSPLMLEEEEQLDFWLFASQLIGDASLMNRTNILVPARIPEEWLLIEKEVALALNRFTLAIVVEGGESSAHAPGDQFYKVHYNPEDVVGRKSLENLSREPFQSSGSHPPHPALLDLHYRLYRLLNESEAGRVWMKETDWSEEVGYKVGAPLTFDEDFEDDEDQASSPVGDPGSVEEGRVLVSGPSEVKHFGHDSTWSAPKPIVIDWEKFKELSRKREERLLDSKYTLAEAFGLRADCDDGRKSGLR